MHNLFTKHGIYFHKSYPNTQQQNGAAERNHRHIPKMTRLFLIDASMPPIFGWMLLVQLSTPLINFLHLACKINPRLKFYFSECLTIHSLNLLIACVFPISWPPLQINFKVDPLNVYSWVTL